MSVSKSLTTHQRDVLVRLTRKCRANPGFPVDLKDFGSVGAVGRLCGKGMVMVVRTLFGPKGGEYPQVAVTSLGERTADYITINGLKTWR